MRVCVSAIESMNTIDHNERTLRVCLRECVCFGNLPATLPVSLSPTQLTIFSNVLAERTLQVISGTPRSRRTPSAEADDGKRNEEELNRKEEENRGKQQQIWLRLCRDSRE